MGNVLITGGTGTIGREIARKLYQHDVTIFSRNEKNQVEMRQECPHYKYIVGDVRDYSEVLKACRDNDYVFHLAALKHIDICEKEPQEAVKSNIIGTLNVVNACNSYGCRLINMSSDKAINPCSIYGKTKSIAEAMVTQSGYVNIRSGNVLWSSGSVLPMWEEQLKTTNQINITSERMTRFFIHPQELALFILSKKDESGTFTVPMKSFRLWDIANEFIKRFGNESSSIKITGLREGERLHEYRDEYTSSEKDVCDDLSYIFQ